jgi:uncharacterized protein YdeI (YjbR/CyaY-like superfamily)
MPAYWVAMPETGKYGRPILAFRSQAEWEAWLEAEHATSDGIWLKFGKKGSGLPSIVYAEAVESALCYGWIDSQASSLDERFYLQKFTPRRPRSKWSKVNRDKVTNLMKQGRLRPAGLAQVELAKADGRWDAAHTAPSEAVVPEDLRRALEETRTPRSSSQPSTSRTATQSSTSSRTRRSPRPARGGWRSSSQC